MWYEKGLFLKNKHKKLQNGLNSCCSSLVAFIFCEIVFLFCNFLTYSQLLTWFYICFWRNFRVSCCNFSFLIFCFFLLQLVSILLVDFGFLKVAYLLLIISVLAVYEIFPSLLIFLICFTRFSKCLLDHFIRLANGIVEFEVLLTGKKITLSSNYIL